MKHYEKTKVSIFFGIVMLTQAVTALIQGAFMFNPLVVDGDIVATMNNVANNQAVAHGSVFLDLITAVVIVALGVAMYHYTYEYNKLLATLAMVMYVFEASMLAASKFVAYGFVMTSVEFFNSGDTALIPIGRVLLQIQQYSYIIHLIPFGIGAFIFYLMLYKAGRFPKWLGLWGAITVIPILVGFPLIAYGVQIPFIVMVPYVPFEFFAGPFILLKGVGVAR